MHDLNSKLGRLARIMEILIRENILRRNRSQKHGRSEKATESLPSNKTSNTIVRGPETQENNREGRYSLSLLAAPRCNW